MVGSKIRDINQEKLASMVEDFMWNDQTDMIIALVDQKLECFLYPNVVFVDNTLLPLLKINAGNPVLTKGPHAGIDDPAGKQPSGISGRVDS